MQSGKYYIDPNRGDVSPIINYSKNSFLDKIYATIQFGRQKYQYWIDASHPYPIFRWGMSLFMLVLFMLRILFCQGWYVVAYALGIYLLNAFLLFLSPKYGPSVDDFDNEADLSDPGPALPVSTDDEFKPFVRRLPEFVFW